MKKKTVKIALAVLLGVLTAAPIWGRAEAVPDKTYVVSCEGTSWMITEDPANVAAFFEYPQLAAGCSREPGMFMLRNDTDEEIQVTLHTVVLPYENKAAMSYFHHLTVTVEDDNGEALYTGPYAGLGKLSFTQIMAAGENRSYTVTMSCDFEYSGVPEQDTAYCLWDFAVEPTAPKTTLSGVEVVPEKPAILLWIIGGAGVVIVICAVFGLVRHRKGKKE